jgi:hypothetical protein
MKTGGDARTTRRCYHRTVVVSETDCDVLVLRACGQMGSGMGLRHFWCSFLGYLFDSWKFP